MLSAPITRSARSTCRSTSRNSSSVTTTGRTPISSDGYAREVEGKLKAAGIRADADLRTEKINYKVREHSLAKVPHLLVVGKREAEEGTVAVRTLGREGQRMMTLDEAITMLTGEATPPDLR